MTKPNREHEYFCRSLRGGQDRGFFIFQETFKLALLPSQAFIMYAAHHPRFSSNSFKKHAYLTFLIRCIHCFS